MGIDESIARNFILDIKNLYVGEEVSRDLGELLADYAEQQRPIRQLSGPAVRSIALLSRLDIDQGKRRIKQRHLA